MPADPAAAATRAPRRARYLFPRDLPHRAEIIAALGAALVAGQLLLAPLTLAVAVACHGVSRVSRWQAQWLLIPAGAGLAWILATGPAGALASFAAGPRAVTGLLAGLIADPARLGELSTLPGLLTSRLAGQLPISLIIGAAEAGAAGWLRWLHTDEWDVRQARPGLLVIARRWLSGREVRAGGVLTRDGACLGIDQRTGRRAVVSWREAQGGILITGTSWPAVSVTGGLLLQAAIRRRKPVIAVDLAGDPGFVAGLAAACAAAEAPLQVLGAGDGLCYYDPLQGGGAARRAGLVVGMLDWAGRPDNLRQACTALLTGIFAVVAAAPAGPGTAVLDDVIRLLDPAALVARLQRVPAYHPRRAALAQRVHAAVSRLESDPEPAALAAVQLAELRASPLGRWLAPGPSGGQSGGRISLTGVVRDRGVALFPLAQAAPGRPARMAATLVALDTAAAFTELHRAGTAADGLAWFGGCEAAEPAALAALLAVGAQAGLACALATTSPQAAAPLTGQVRVVAAHRLADAELAGLIAPLTGSRLVRAAGPAVGSPVVTGAPAVVVSGAPAAMTSASAAGTPAAGPAAGQLPVAPFGVTRCPVVSAGELCARPEDEFTLAVRAPGGRVVAHVRAVAARVPAPRPVRPARIARLARRAGSGAAGAERAAGPGWLVRLAGRAKAGEGL